MRHTIGELHHAIRKMERGALWLLVGLVGAALIKIPVLLRGGVALYAIGGAAYQLYWCSTRYLPALNDNDLWILHQLELRHDIEGSSTTQEQLRKSLSPWRLFAIDSLILLVSALMLRMMIFGPGLG